MNQPIPDGLSDARVLDLVNAVLPVTSLDRVLESLAHFWLDASGAAAALVTATPNRTLLRGCLADRTQTGRLIETTGIFGDQWPQAATIAALTENIGATSRVTSSTLAFPFSNEPAGVALLFAGTAPTISNRQIRRAVDICGCLVGQALAQEQTLTDQRLESLAEFAAGAGHEINNPVASIVGRARLLLRDESDPDRQYALATIAGQAYRIRDMIGDTMLFGRPPEPQRTTLNFVTVVREVIDSLNDTCTARQVEIHFDGPHELQLCVDDSQLRVVVSNLIRNSIDAEPADHTVHVTLRLMEIENRTMAQLEVTDNGRGLTEPERVHLFDPFYSGRQAGRGLGFGLPKCWRIIVQHGGSIDCASDRGRTAFTVTLPID